jgi:hypothetical protein
MKAIARRLRLPSRRVKVTLKFPEERRFVLAAPAAGPVAFPTL